jgi:hypothetical protein
MVTAARHDREKSAAVVVATGGGVRVRVRTPIDR